MSTPAKYSHINFTPPVSVRKAAQRGLDLRKEYGRGGLSTQEAGKQGIGSGVARATSLVNGQAQSPETISRMVGFFARHAKNLNSKTESGKPGNGMIAGLLWGGKPGEAWAGKVFRQMKIADERKDERKDEAAWWLSDRSPAYQAAYLQTKRDALAQMLPEDKKKPCGCQKCKAKRKQQSEASDSKKS
jgi:hypothetical protein